MKLVMDLLNLSYVKRWVIAPTHREQSVAEHSFRVAALVMGLHNAMMVGQSELPFDMGLGIVASMTHDVDEVYSGDIPGTFKDSGGKDWPHPSSMIKYVVAMKVADSLETYDWWQKHGDKTWTHPNAPGKGDQNRDIRKIRWYCQNWPELLEAVKAVMAGAMGYDRFTVEQLFG